MILLIGVDCDRTVNYISDYLVEKHIDFVFLNMDELGASVRLSNDYIQLGNRYIRYDQITGVFNRMVASLDHVIDNKSYMAAYEILCYALDFEIDNVINKPSQTASNNSKPYQLNLVQTNHINIPETQIYANCDSAKDLSNSEKVYVYKSVSSFRSIVNQLHVSDYDRRVTCPTIFQEKINGPNYRVHVVDNKIFPLKIVSDTIDYRYYYQYVERFEEAIPDCIAQECINITKQLSLRLSGMDLIKQDESYYLLEINTYPGYDSFEEYMSGTPITDCLLEKLLG